MRRIAGFQKPGFECLDGLRLEGWRKTIWVDTQSICFKKNVYTSLNVNTLFGCGKIVLRKRGTSWYYLLSLKMSASTAVQHTLSHLLVFSSKRVHLEGCLRFIGWRSRICRVPCIDVWRRKVRSRNNQLLKSLIWGLDHSVSDGREGMTSFNIASLITSLRYWMFMELAIVWGYGGSLFVSSNFNVFSSKGSSLPYAQTL